ncbi:hypothetical protein [Reichenbachiella versicolor]|uniref:hypothetical protein n=1 Tax=Reichenbachiella versicolor TaxID=1821036 RepID=UPI000D6E1989|nr:hypothetical protein [Reichenbachiella versicolor]
MRYNIEDVRHFVENVFQSEIKIRRYSFESDATNAELEDRFLDFQDECLSLYADSPFNYLNAYNGKKSDEDKQKWLNRMAERKIFLIKEYKKPIYTASKEYVSTLSNTLYVIYSSGEYKNLNNEYITKFYATEIEGKIKLIWYKNVTAEGKWKSYEDFELIKDEGEFVKALKLEAPENKENLRHYNSF